MISFVCNANHPSIPRTLLKINTTSLHHFTDAYKITATQQVFPAHQSKGIPLASLGYQ
jgi:hypothetical protein